MMCDFSILGRLQHAALYCSNLQHTARTATRYDTLQYIATYLIPLLKQLHVPEKNYGRVHKFAQPLAVCRCAAIRTLCVYV